MFSFNWKLTDNTMGATFSNHLANLQYSGHFVQAIPLQCSAFLPESLDAQTMTDGIVWLIASLAGRRYAADGGRRPTP